MVTQVFHHTSSVRNCDAGFARIPESVDSVDALRLKGLVAYGEDFVNNQYVWAGVDRDRKRQAQNHSGRVSTEGLVNELFDSRKCNDFIESTVQFFSGQPQQGCVKDDIL